MSTYDKAHELANALKNSAEFNDFKSAKETIEKDAKTKEMVYDFKKKQFELQTEHFSGKEPDKEKVATLHNLYNILVANSEISKYFEAEYRFSQMISDVYKIIGESVEMDFDFMK
jgi:cell fate (sporulation/competence/biofilm development) regulator YlbF (YheA/YmcA/DUF963 family)